MVFFIPSRKTLRLVARLGYERFLPNPSHFIIRNRRVIRRYIFKTPTS